MNLRCRGAGVGPPCGLPEQHQHRHEKRLKVTVPVDVSVVVHGHLAEGLEEEKNQS